MTEPPDAGRPPGANQKASKTVNERNHYKITLAEIGELVKEAARGIKAVVFSGVIP
jgi:hypothetical protein